MEAHLDKKLEAFTSKLMKESSLESPSLDFTHNIMSQVELLSTRQAIIYKPLISKTGWMLIGLGILALTVYLIFTSQPTQLGWFDNVNFNVLVNNKVTNSLGSIKFSKTMMYAIVFFGIMMCIQIPLLKNYFDKRLEF